ncbi:MAG: VOC family protein [Desulfobacterales bacterium]
MTDKPVFQEVLQVGLVVRDLDKSIEKYTKIMGIGPWKVYHLDKRTLKNVTVKGKPQDLSMKVGFAQIGKVQIELIQPLEDGGIYAEFLEMHGEGLHHIACAVDDYDETITRLAKGNIGILQAGDTSDGMGFAYLDTMNVMGCITEIYRYPKRRSAER